MTIRFATVLIIQLHFFIGMMRLANAQTDALNSIRKICSAYTKTYTVSFNGTMKMYNKNDPAKIIERVSASYLLNAGSFKCSIGPVEMLLNNRYYVSVDKSVKIIIIGNKKDLNATMQSPVLNIDQIGKWIKEKNIDATVIKQNKIDVLELKDPKRVTGYDYYQIIYDHETGFMQKVLLELSDDNDVLHKTMVLEINYTRPLVQEGSRDMFSEKQFFSIRQNKIEVKNNYKGYQLINQL